MSDGWQPKGNLERLIEAEAERLGMTVDQFIEYSVRQHIQRLYCQRETEARRQRKSA